MKIRTTLLVLLWLLPALRSPAATPGATMFRGQVTSAEAAELSMAERSAAACRRFKAEKDGAVFFTAWAFPACERIRCGRGDGDRPEAGPLTVQNRNGRIAVNSPRGHGLNLSSGPDQNNGTAWAVLLLLNRTVDGRCQVSDMAVLDPDREYDLGHERLAWLGAVDEERGLEFIRVLIGAGEAKLRKDLVFALYLFNGKAAVSELIGLARRDPAPEVRKQAVFWLGQKASAEAVKALGDVLASPESLELKKQAVFALSQLPDDIGTPKLLDIARGHPQPQVRKAAIFWLGQSDDPRALDLFTEILTK